MTKKDLYEFVMGLSWEKLAGILDRNYKAAVGEKLKLYKKIDKIETELDLRRIMTLLSVSIMLTGCKETAILKEALMMLLG